MTGGRKRSVFTDCSNAAIRWLKTGVTTCFIRIEPRRKFYPCVELKHTLLKRPKDLVGCFTQETTGVLIGPQPDQEGNNLQRQKILMFIYPIYKHNWRNISTIYIYNKSSIKRNILTSKKKKIGKQVGLRTYQHHGKSLKTVSNKVLFLIAAILFCLK